MSGSLDRGRDGAGGASRPGRGCPAVVLGDLTLVRPLAWVGVPVIVVTTDPQDVTLRSRYVRDHIVVPGFVGAAQAETAAALRALGERLTAALGRRVPLFYGQDKQLELLYRHRPALERHFSFLLNEEARAWELLDKERFAALCARVGVRAPRSLALGEASDADLLSLRPPLLVKPRRKVDWKEIQRLMFDGSSKARIFPDAAALLAHPALPHLRDRLLVQEAIEGPVTDLVSFHGFVAEDGRLLASFCGRKLRTYPRFAGESALIELVASPEIEAEGRDVATRLGLRGPFKIDFVRDPRSGAFYTLEVNARFNLWNHLGAAEGVNLLAVAYDYLVDGTTPAPAPTYVPHTRWVSALRVARGLREEGRDQLHALLGTLGLFGRRVVHETFDWRDPLPFLFLVAGLLRGKAQRRLPAWRPTG